jgi:hypothetical protein
MIVATTHFAIVDDLLADTLKVPLAHAFEAFSHFLLHRLALSATLGTTHWAGRCQWRKILHRARQTSVSGTRWMRERRCRASRLFNVQRVQISTRPALSTSLCPSHSIVTAYGEKHKYTEKHDTAYMNPFCLKLPNNTVLSFPSNIVTVAIM